MKKEKVEFLKKLMVACALAFLMTYVLTPATSTSDAIVGGYNPFTDKIWIQENLPEDQKAIVRTHEECHRAFFQTLPFFKYIMCLGLISGFVCLTMIYLGVLTKKVRLVYIACAWWIMLFIPETHAYGTTLFQYGLNDLTIGFFFYMGLSMGLFAFALLMKKFLKQKSPSPLFSSPQRFVSWKKEKIYREQFSVIHPTFSTIVKNVV